MRISTQVLGSLATTALATAQTGNGGANPQVDGGANPRVTVGSCKSLSCNAPGSSICGEKWPKWPTMGVGIAPQVVNTSSASLSFTLVDGWRENSFGGIGSEAYQHSSYQLFVGTGAGQEAPLGCALMMQYLGQTFPLEAPGKPERPVPDEDTTSCTGVLDVDCRGAIVDIIRGFRPSSEANDTHCGRLTEHVNAELQKVSGTCGGNGTWIANFMNVTGGALPMANSTQVESPDMGDDQCRLTEPQGNGMYEVAAMRQFTFANPPAPATDFLRSIYGGRAGITPVAAVIYGSDKGYDDGNPDVQFACMKTFKQDGSPRDWNQYRSGATALRALGQGVTTALLVAAVAFL